MRRPTDLLLSPAFVLTVGLLLLNDWVLKDAFGSWWTGKLSDVTGLFAFPLFWSAFLPRHRNAIYALTAIGFVIWKTPLVGPVIDAWNGIGVWTIARVVDYTDYIALLALPASYRLSEPGIRPPRQAWPVVLKRVATTAMASMAAIAFLATSMTEPEPSYDFPAGSDYQVNGPRVAVKAFLLSHEWFLVNNPNRTSARDTLYDSSTEADTALTVYVTLRDTVPCGTIMALSRLKTARKTPNVTLIRDSLVLTFVEPLQARFPTC